LLRVIFNALVLVTWTPWCAGLVLLVRLFTGSADLAYRIFRFWARSSCRMWGIEVVKKGDWGRDDGNPHVYVGNHPTSFEPLAMMCVVDGRLASVGKKELRRIPLVGWVTWAVGWIFIDRGDPESARLSIEAAAAKIHAGLNVAIFPEGRRTETPDTLQPFKKGPFHLALNTKVPIKPVRFVGWEKLIPRGALVPRSGTLEARFGEAIEVDPDDDVESLMTRTRLELEKLFVRDNGGGKIMASEYVPPIKKLIEWNERTPDAPALHVRTDGGWSPVTWKQYHDRACRLGAALVALGHEEGECVVILSANRAEWLYAQYGIMMASGVVTPCYMTNPPGQVAYLMAHCKARIAFVENASQLDKVIAVKDRLPDLEHVIVFDAVEDPPDWVMDYERFLDGATEKHQARCKERQARMDPDADSFIIYTSGTTGNPKAVAISHNNMAHGGPAILQHYPIEKTRTICYLPLCHIAEQSATNMTQLMTGGEVYICPSVDDLPRVLPDVRPNTLFGVPRIWEKVEATLESKFDAEPPLKRKLVRWALDVEARAFETKARSGEEPVTVSRWLANRLVIDRIKKKMGLDEIQYTLTGAAPISVKTLRFFASLGFRVQEVYGLSETAGILTATLPGDVAIGTVGKPMKGVEIQIAEDGEILARGPGLSRGYLHDPESTEELWEGGWMHTGDIGEFDESGNLRITDRKKDLIITAQAKNIAPQPIEAKLKRIPGISQSVVVGDMRKYLIALLTIDEVHAPAIASSLGIESRDLAKIARDDAFVEHVGNHVEKINETLARYETIKRFEILPRDFTIEDGEMTPTMKVKRRVVVKKHADLIDRIYAR
jgi:1-acyl-sn-glycerol-3-phosphate acyltransferase